MTGNLSQSQRKRTITWLRVGDEQGRKEMSCRRLPDVGARYHAKAGCHLSNVAPPSCSHRLDSARNRTGAPYLSLHGTDMVLISRPVQRN